MEEKKETEEKKKMKERNETEEKKEIEKKEEKNVRKKRKARRGGERETNGEGFKKIKTTGYLRYKVAAKGSQTPEERRELVLRENHFWLSNKADSNLSFGVGKPFLQLDGNDSLSESEDEAPAEKKKVASKRKGKGVLR